MKAAAAVRSWGNVPRVEHAAVKPLYWRHLPLPAAAGPVLAVGMSRSYGDSGLNAGATLLATAALDRLIGFDAEAGTLRCEAGATLDALLAFIVPRGWFLPVVPGTAQVTVGGAIANDVHGKNHHAAGSFGRHVAAFELLRSDGTRTVCSATQEPARFRATIGGLGLTGLITWAELRLRRIASPAFDVETRRMRDLDDFFALSAEADRGWEYTVSWIDGLARGRAIGRGVFMRANHAADAAQAAAPKKRPSLPFDFPDGVLNRHSVAAFNALYRRRAPVQWRASRAHYRPFLFPLDGIGHWNRMYGARGFFQHQSVLPQPAAPGALRRMLEAIALSGEASFLSVLKVFGAHEPAGLLSFPRPGVTLALDFPNRGPSTLALLDRLDEFVRAAGGAIYPAKDARMAPETFRAGFPAWKAFEEHVDPAFSSSFWRRVTR